MSGLEALRRVFENDGIDVDNTDSMEELLRPCTTQDFDAVVDIQFSILKCIFEGTEAGSLSTYNDEWFAYVMRTMQLNEFDDSEGREVAVNERRKSFTGSLMRLCIALNVCYYTCDETDFTEAKHAALHTQIRRLFHAYDQLYEAIHRMCYIESVDSGRVVCYREQDSLLGFSAYSEVDSSEVEQVYVYVIQQLGRQGLRRKRDECWEMITFEGDDGSTVRSRAWRRRCDIAEFVDACIVRGDKDTNAMWDTLHRQHNLKGILYDYLCNCNESEFMPLKEGHFFSYRNGVHHIGDAGDLERYPHEYKGRFYEYGEELDEFERAHGDVVSIRLWSEIPFDLGLMAKSTRWCDIASPHMDLILNPQLLHMYGGYVDAQSSRFKWELLTCKQEILGFLGRGLFPAGELDNFQKCVFFRGSAGTGKSTLLNFIKSFFNDEDVGVLSCHAQEVFCMEGIYDKKIVLIPEVKENMRFSSSDLNQWISTEWVAVALKLKPVHHMRFQLPIFMAGNESLFSEDMSGAKRRRFHEILLKKQIPANQVNSRLEQDMNEERSALACMMVGGYHALIRDSRVGRMDAVVRELLYHLNHELCESDEPAYVEDINDIRGDKALVGDLGLDREAIQWTLNRVTNGIFTPLVENHAANRLSLDLLGEGGDAAVLRHDADFETVGDLMQFARQCRDTGCPIHPCAMRYMKNVLGREDANLSDELSEEEAVGMMQRILGAAECFRLNVDHPLFVYLIDADTLRDSLPVERSGESILVRDVVSYMQYVFRRDAKILLVNTAVCGAAATMGHVLRLVDVGEQSVARLVQVELGCDGEMVEQLCEAVTEKVNEIIQNDPTGTAPAPFAFDLVYTSQCNVWKALMHATGSLDVFAEEAAPDVDDNFDSMARERLRYVPTITDMFRKASAKEADLIYSFVDDPTSGLHVTSMETHRIEIESFKDMFMKYVKKEKPGKYKRVPRPSNSECDMSLRGIGKNCYVEMGDDGYSWVVGVLKTGAAREDAI